MVEIPENTREAIDILNRIQRESEDAAIIVVLSKDEVKILKTIIKDREAFGRVFSWLIYIIGGAATVLAGWSVISGYWNK